MEIIFLRYAFLHTRTPCLYITLYLYYYTILYILLAVLFYRYGSYFDSVIINHEQERAYRDLLKEIAFIEREPQWVPKQWLGFE